MGCFEVRKVFVIKNFEEHTITVPRRAAADEFAICGAECVEDCVVEFAIVGNKVEFVSVDYVEGWSADGVGVVWESFDVASIGKVDLGSLWFEGDVGWKVVGEGSYAGEDAFGLAP